MKIRAVYFLSLLLLATSIIACKKNDDEPILPPTRISRLYVSFSDVQTDDLAVPFNNIAVFDPADSVSLAQPVYFNSQVVEGAGIFFNPTAKRAFQGSVQNFTIKTFSVSVSGVLGPGTSFTDSTLTSQPDMAYDAVSTNLYVSNNLTNSIHAYEKGAQRNGILKNGPNKRFVLSAQPRGLVLDNDSIMVVLRTSDGVNEIGLLENPSKIDSGIVSLAKKITVTGASDLRGIAYSHKLNLLVVSDAATSKVYFIENAREAFTQNLAFASNELLSGALTRISQPIDVAIDDRDDKMFLYVADRAESTKSILRFNLSDRGNVAPQTVFALPLLPASIYLDAR
jgi:hypothetical protein